MAERLVTLLLLLILSSCLKFGKSQQDCLAFIDNQLLCDPFAFQAGSNELLITCDSERSSWTVSHNIPSLFGDIEYIEIGVICGTDCNNFRRISTLEQQNDNTLSGQVSDNSTATECIVTGCYEIKQGAFVPYHFATSSCTIGPQSTPTTLSNVAQTSTMESTATTLTEEVETTDANVTMPSSATTLAYSTSATTATTLAYSTSATTATTPAYSTSATTIFSPFTVLPRNTLTITIPVLIVILILSVTTIVIFMLSVRCRREKKIRVYHYQLQSIAHLNDEFHNHLKVDTAKLDFSKNISASEPSLLFALDQIPTLHMTKTMDMKKYLQPGIKSEKPMPISSTNLQEQIGQEETLMLPCYDTASLNSISLISDNVKGETIKKSPEPSIHLDHPLQHEEDSYYEIESSKGQNFQIPTSNSVLSLRPMGVLDHFPCESGGYLDYGNKHNISGHEKPSKFTSNNIPTDFEHPTASNDGYIDYQGENSSAACPQNLPLVLDIESSDDTDSDIAPSLSPSQSNEDTAVVFEFGASIPSKNIEYEDSQMTSPDEESPKTVQTSFIPHSPTTPVSTIAFNFATHSKSTAHDYLTQESADHFVDTLLQDPIDSKLDPQNYAESANDFATTIFEDSTVIEVDQQNSGGFGMTSLEAEINLDFSTNSEEDLCTPYGNHDNNVLRYLRNDIQTTEKEQTYLETICQL